MNTHSRVLVAFITLRSPLCCYRFSSFALFDFYRWIGAQSSQGHRAALALNYF